MQIGAQLFTLREFTRDLNAFSETLKKVADIGYRTVQISGTCEYSPEWLAKELEKNGLTCALTHFNPEKIRTEPDKTVEVHRKFGCKYIGIGCIPGGIAGFENVDNFIDDYLPAAKRISESGCYFMYHNHHFEFMHDADGVTYFQRLADGFSAEEMGFTLDTYWVQFGGASPEDWIRRLKGRVPCIHLKDLAIVSGVQKMAVIGEGNINFDRVISAAEDSGTEYLLVEQDDCNGEDPFECLKRSYANLSSMGLK